MPWGTSGTTTQGFADDVEARGQQREVRALEDGSWVVEGDPKLGDTFDYYQVDRSEEKYECSCYRHAYGDVRRRRVCGHVRDVIYWRKHHDEKDHLAAETTEADEGDSETGAETGTARDHPPRIPETADLVPETADLHQRRTGEAVDGVPGPGEARKPDRSRRDDAESGPTQPSPGERPVEPVETGALTTRDPALGDPPLPAQFAEFRPHQQQAIRDVLSAYERGARIVFLDAPTGSGKTLIAEAVRRLRRHRQTVYVCTNKALQDQFTGDFTYAKLLKGRANYPTLNTPEAFPDVNCSDCNISGNAEEGFRCDECWDTKLCHYRLARTEAEFAPLSVLNTAYLLTATNGPQMFRGRDLVVCDEADELESELMRHIEVVVSKGLRNWLAIDLPPNVSDMGLWSEWLDDVADRVADRAKRLSRRDRKERKRRRQLMELVEKINVVSAKLDEDWVVDGYEDARRRRGSIERQTVRFRPVHVRDLARQYLWRHAERWLLMSATIISPAQMAEDLGLEDGEWASVTVESTFPPERRPVFVDRHVGPITRATESEALPKLVGELEHLAVEWSEERILVHTHSYSLTRHLRENLSVGRPIFSYMDSREREGILDRWLETADGVLLAPSFDRGVDLPDGKCRVQVIAKVPYPYLGDKQVKKRLGAEGGQIWYVVETIRSIVQATGRVMRSEDDWGATYVLDGSVWRLLRENGQLFPSWWREAIVRGLDAQSREVRGGFEEVANG